MGGVIPRCAEFIAFYRLDVWMSQSVGMEGEKLVLIGLFAVRWQRFFAQSTPLLLWTDSGTRYFKYFLMPFMFCDHIPCIPLACRPGHCFLGLDRTEMQMKNIELNDCDSSLLILQQWIWKKKLISIPILDLSASIATHLTWCCFGLWFAFLQNLSRGISHQGREGRVCCWGHKDE